MLSRREFLIDALPTDDIRRFIWHCHILEHEDNSMMRPYVLV